MNRIYLLLTLLFTVSGLLAQKHEVRGVLKDTAASIPVRNAVVALVAPQDSVLKAFTRSGSDGSFKLSAEKGRYILMVMHPSFGDLVDNVTVESQPVNLNTVALTPKSKLLEAVIIRSGTPIRIKGDTTIYTADSFKVSANANVEELLKKLPGIQVDRNGQIMAMGQTVEKVLVDGEEFFGDDPGMAVKNLRADAVKEVQVFDKKSEQAEFTGIDDGQTQKTINLKLKEDKKKGYFGKADLAAGPQEDLSNRFNNNLMYSSFKGKRKFSGFILNGNTGQDGLNWQDMQKFGMDDNSSIQIDEEGGGIMITRGGTSDDEPYVNTQNGFIRNLNGGIQYTNKFGENLLNLTPRYNEQDYVNNRQSFIQTQVFDTATGQYASLNEISNQVTNVDRYNVKFRGSYDMKMDSMNSLKITANLNYYDTESVESREGSRTGKDGQLINTSVGRNTISSEKMAFTGNLLFRHKFKKARRTFSLNGDWSILNTDGTNFNRSVNTIYDPSNPFVLDVDQMLNYDKVNRRISGKATYTEPLNDKYAVELSHETSLNSGVNDQVTYTYSASSGKYDEQVDSLTNRFDQTILVNKPAARLSYSHKKIKFSLGSGFAFTHFNLEDVTYNNTFKRNFTNFFPQANFTYTYKSNHMVRFNYSGYTSQPTMNQLQPLRNNNDQFNEYIGNPNLKPSFTNSWSISHNGYDFLKDRWMYQSLNFSTTANSIKNDRRIDLATGKTVTMPVNTDGNFNLSFWSGVGLKSKKLNTRINVNPRIMYSRFADVINNVISYSRTTNTGISFNLNKSKDKKYDISLTNDFSYTHNRNSQANTKFDYYANTITAEATVYFDKVWSISSDYNYFSREKTSQLDKGLNNQLWNARIQRTFKNDEFTVYALVRDILNENIGIDRNFSGNTFSEVRNDRLKRYFMLGFAWNFKNKGASPDKK